MVVVQITKRFKNIDIDPPKLKKLVKAICSRFKLSKATVGIALIDDAEIRKVNRRFLNRNHPADVISFNLSDNDANVIAAKGGTQYAIRNLALERSEGTQYEIVVNAEMAVREANLRGHSSEAELALYITHGLLHNLGFDDSQKAQAKKMHDTEDEILQQQGFGLVYNKSIRVQEHKGTRA